MTDTSTVVQITDRARAVIAFAEERDKIIVQIAAEKVRHNQAMEVLLTKEQALEQAIFKLGAN